MGCTGSTDVDRPRVHPTLSAATAENPLCAGAVTQDRSTQAVDIPPRYQSIPARNDSNPSTFTALATAASPRQVPAVPPIVEVEDDSQELRGSVSKSTEGTADDDWLPDATAPVAAGSGDALAHMFNAAVNRACKQLAETSFDAAEIPSTSPAKLVRGDVSRKSQRPPPPPTREAAILRVRHERSFDSRTTSGASQSTRSSPFPSAAPSLHVRRSVNLSCSRSSARTVRASTAERREARFDARSVAHIEAQLDVAMGFITRGPHPSSQ